MVYVGVPWVSEHMANKGLHGKPAWQTSDEGNMHGMIWNNQTNPSFHSALKAAISHKMIRGGESFTSNAPADEKTAYELEVLPPCSVSLRSRSR